MGRDEVTLRQIEAFHAAATSPSLAAAARELGLTRAAVSRSIRMLEQSLGQPLFMGLGRRRRLTEAATALLPHVEETVGAWRALCTSLREIERPARPESKTAKSPRRKRLPVLRPQQVTARS